MLRRGVAGKGGWRVAACVGMALGAIACEARGATQILVVVDTDLAVPDGLGSIAFDADRADGEARCVCGGARSFLLAGPSPESLPLSFAVVPRDPDDVGEVSIEICGCDGSEVIVRRHVRTRFEPGVARQLDVFLAASCRGMACGPGESCLRGACAGDFIDPGSLPLVRPGEDLRRDATAVRDASADAPVDGGPPRDASVAPWGDSCSTDSECAADGFVCASEVDGYPAVCLPACRFSADCTSRDARSECVPAVAPATGRICSVPCDPRSSTGCAEGQACIVVPSCGAPFAAHTTCRAAGSTELGAVCAIDQECVVGATCVRRTPDAMRECLETCVTFADCSTGTRCARIGCPAGGVPAVDGVAYGVCL